MEIIVLTVLLLIAELVTAGNGNCPENLFYCDNECRDLSIDKMCDLTNDCADGSDEQDCTKKPPRILSTFNNPSQYIEYFGSTAYKVPKEIQCIASGSPPIEYTWKGNGHEVQNVEDVIKYDRSTGVLTLYNPIALGKSGWGQYQCLAINAAGSSMSDIILVEHAYLEPLPTGSNNQERADEYQYAKIICQDKPGSNPAPFYSWHRKIPETVSPDDDSLEKLETSKRIAIDLLGDLHFVYVMIEDSSNPEHYLCGVYNDKSLLSTYGSDTNLVVEAGVDVYRKPEIKFHSKVSAQLDSAAKIQCIFSGYPTPDVEWYDTASQRIFSDGIKYKLEDFDRILKVLDVNEIDEGQYQCRGKNDIGQTEKIPIILNLVGPPIWEQKLEHQTVPAGHDVEFNCRARSLHGEPDLDPPEWFRNGEKFGILTKKFEFSDGHKKLVITNVQKDYDIMCIQCKYENDIGVAFSDASLFILNPIEIVAHTPTPTNDREITIEPDSVITLFVNAHIDEPITLIYEWMFDNNTIMTDGPYTVESGGQNLTIDTRSLNDDEFANLQGLYTAKIYHDYEEKFDTLTVLTAPRVITLVGKAGGDLWWIAIVLAILVVFILILLIICCLYRNRGGTWPVDRKERAAGHDPEKELADSGFHDLARADDDDDDYFKKTKADEISLPSDKPMASDDDEDSMLEYGGEMDTSKFNEEGSFIGIYGEKKGKLAPPPTQSTV